MQLREASLIAMGVGALLMALAGLVSDIRNFDTTSGGYEAPYTGYTGEPIDWTRLEVTETGVVQRGYIVDVHVNGTTGMITLSTLGMRWDFRPLSERALVVHRPREGLKALGFEPAF